MPELEDDTNGRRRSSISQEDDGLVKESSRGRSLSPSQSPKRNRRGSNSQEERSPSPPPKKKHSDDDDNNNDDGSNGRDNDRKRRSRSRSGSKSRSPRRGRSRSGSPPRALYVKGLTDRITQDDLKEEFAKFGNVQDVYIPLDYHSKKTRGFAYIKYDDNRHAEEAHRSMTNLEVCGESLVVEWAMGNRKTPKEMRRNDPRKPRDDYYRPGRGDRRNRDRRDDNGLRGDFYRRRSRSPPRRRRNSPPPRRRSRSPRGDGRDSRRRSASPRRRR